MTNIPENTLICSMVLLTVILNKNKALLNETTTWTENKFIGPNLAPLRGLFGSLSCLPSSTPQAWSQPNLTILAGSCLALFPHIVEHLVMVIILPQLQIVMFGKEPDCTPY